MEKVIKEKGCQLYSNRSLGRDQDREPPFSFVHFSNINLPKDHGTVSSFLSVNDAGQTCKSATQKSFSPSCQIDNEVMFIQNRFILVLLRPSAEAASACACLPQGDLIYGRKTYKPNQETLFVKATDRCVFWQNIMVYCESHVKKLKYNVGN